ncbi:MAG TPA: Bax inhibitor-1 family protein [Solirubrobacteraceae bacterium]|nr:Bax inhibitor-1 family protein [Solirubrobacteraceae bacterium]
MPLGTRTYRGGPQSGGYGYGGTLTRDQTRGVFGQVMGLVALTIGFLALGAYVGRNINGGSSFIFIVLGFGCVFGLNYAAARGREQLAIGLLFGMGLFLGLFISPVLVYYTTANPGVVYQAAGATAGFTAAMAAYGYATRRDLAVYARAFFWALIGLIVFGLITLFVVIPGSNIIYCVLGLGIFAFFTAFDFQRLRSANMTMAVPIAASIFLDVFNVFLLFLSLFGGGGTRRN